MYIEIVDTVTLIENIAKRFVGNLRPEQKTKYAFHETIKRYQACVSSINRAITINVGFAFLSLYAFYLIPQNEAFKAPYVDVYVSREIWLSIVPVIGYALQLWVLTSFIWFMYLRLRIISVVAERGSDNEFGEISDICLSGIMGQIWISYKVLSTFKSKLKYLWSAPAAFILAIIVFSPLIILVYFIIELFILGDFWLGSVYALFLIPYSIFFFALIVVSGILIVGEWASRLENEIGERISLMKELSEIITKNDSNNSDKS